MIELFDSTVELLISFINNVGYFGIFIGMFLESTLIPIPSELVMIPAGMSASKGGMDLGLLITVGLCGNVSGAVFSYYLARVVGRNILFKVGKFFLIKPQTIIKIENFFKAHGSISIFIGRLLPGFRHFISLPAGVAKMDIKLFLLYTTVGSFIWTSVLTVLGFFIGANQKLIKEYLSIIGLGLVIFCAVLVTIYIFLKPTRQ